MKDFIHEGRRLIVFTAEDKGDIAFDFSEFLKDVLDEGWTLVEIDSSEDFLMKFVKNKNQKRG